MIKTKQIWQKAFLVIMFSLAISLRFVLGDFYCHVNVQRLLPLSVSFCVTTAPSSDHTQNCRKNPLPWKVFGDRPEFVSSLEKLLVYSLCFHIRIQRVTPVTQSHWVCSAAAWNWEPCTQKKPLKCLHRRWRSNRSELRCTAKKRVILRGETSHYLQN